MNEHSFERAQNYALSRLRDELSPNLLYHNLEHTTRDVLPFIEKVAPMEGVTNTPYQLLLTAALFHDMGFVEQAAYHELISARIAGDTLRWFGYTGWEVETIRWIIMATIVPQKPKTILERIMADADLNVLGRTDFLERNIALRAELANFGKTYTDRDWYTGQIKFIENHSYFTNSAQSLLNEQKAINIAILKSALAAL